MTLPLEGIKVLELGHIVAGPTAGHILGDLGADVLKVETVEGGDKARRMPNASVAMFHFLNRNKRSIAIDLKNEEGREVFLRLAGDAHVIVDNFAYGAIDRLGIGFDVVNQTNPGVIWLSIKGFLPGPSEQRPMLDELAQMAGGLAFMTGPEGAPMRAGASVIDVGAAAYGVIAVLAALREREVRGGKGQQIIAGLYETSVYSVAQWMATSQFSGEPSRPMAAEAQDKRMGFSVYRLFSTADDNRVFIGIVSDAHWGRFCAEFGLAHLASDPRFAEHASRLANQSELKDAVAEVIRAYSSAEVERRLETAKLPFAPVRRPDQLAQERHLVDSDQLVAVPMPNGVTAKLPKLPFRASGFDMRMRNPSPALGEHTREVLATLGYAGSDVDSMVQRGVVGV